ncbi:MAG TPA: methyltransferase domain-containing protein [Marmoricola sp.]|nr:methyltransferase domain-containing protein [Marmoricola sp.]
MVDGSSQRRTHVRGALIWDALVPLLDHDSLTVLDVGGGSGALAVRVAEAGHAVTLIDPSPDAVAAAGRRADERGVAGRVTALVGDLDSLEELAQGPFDLVLCHDVLGVAEDPSAALGQLRQVLKSGGHLSLVVGQLPAAVLSRVAAGHVDQALALLRREDADLPRRFEYAETLGFVENVGFAIDLAQGIRVFADSVPSAVVDSDPDAYADLVELERAVASRPEYATWAAQLHVLARRP